MHLGDQQPPRRFTLRCPPRIRRPQGAVPIFHDSPLAPLTANGMLANLSLRIKTLEVMGGAVMFECAICFALLLVRLVGLFVLLGILELATHPIGVPGKMMECVSDVWLK